LNDQQKAVVTHIGNLLVTACPGSGKTRVITHKVAYEVSLLEEISKQRIAALTFTNRASDEMYKRLNKMGISDERIWIGTLHSFCYEWIIRPYAVCLEELKHGYSVADEAYCKDLLNRLKDENEIKHYVFTPTSFKRDGTPFCGQYGAIVNEFNAILISNKLISYDMIIYYSYRIVSEFPRVAVILSNIFRYICVDEYQDTTDLLYGIISCLVKANGGATSLFMVGDIDQAIYGSLGGIPKTLEEISQEIAPVPIKQKSLTGNYRSSQRIIDFYSYFQTNKILIEALGENKDEHGLITYNKSIHKDYVLNEIIRLIRYHLDQGCNENEICILVPQWALIRKVSRLLRVKMRDVSFDASAMSPLSTNRNNIWYKVCRLLLSEPSPKIIHLRYKWAGELIDDLSVYTNTDMHNVFESKSTILKVINSIKSEEEDGIAYLEDCFIKFSEYCGISIDSNLLLKESYNSFFDAIQKNKAEQESTEYEVDTSIDALKQFYKEMTGVVINTCHGVKGEEFRTVIAFGILQKMIPHWAEINANNGNRQARKMLYVICSRAKLNLHLISETMRTDNRKVVYYPTELLDCYNYDYDDLDFLKRGSYPPHS